MKIQGRKPPEAHELNISTHKAQKLGSAEGREKVASSQGQQQVDRIDISPKGKEVASLIATINKLPEVREEKVQALKEAINAGTYKINPLKVAEKMLSEI
ncbi:MAG: flagellar biosynthesis anti-sigma factor FlgM [Thermodesulfovibrionales bacterium]